MPRLFTGLEIPAATTARLALCRGGLPAARWIEPEDYHITLRFVGDVGLPVANELARSLEQSRGVGFEIEFEGLRAFGGDKPRAIVATVRASQALSDLQADHERRCRRIGLPAEARKFTPHVTLARLKTASPYAVADYLGSWGAPNLGGFRAGRFVLFSAREGVGGGPYVVEADYPLSAAPPP